MLLGVTGLGSQPGEKLRQPRSDAVHVASAADERYAVGLVVTLASTVTHLPARDIDLSVLDCGLSPATRRRLSAAAARWPTVRSLTFLDPGLADLAAFPAPRHLTSATYARLRLPHLLPEVDRLLFLDADVVVTGDVGVLFDETPTGAAIAAAPDFAYPTVGTGLPGVDLPPDRTYWNAGVLLVELETWRQRRLAQEILGWATAHREQIRFADQDAINAVLGGEVLELDPSWNVQVGPLQAQLRGAADDRRAQLAIPPSVFLPRARIWHFPGGKPWQGSGLQSNRLSLRAHLYWWRALGAAGVVPRRTVVRTAVRALGGTASLARERWSPV